MKHQSPQGHVEDGLIVNLTCQTDSAYPAARITWKKDGQNVTIRSTSSWSIGVHEGMFSTSTLLVNSTREDNNHTYECSLVYNGRNIAELSGKFELDIICELFSITILIKSRHVHIINVSVADFWGCQSTLCMNRYVVYPIYGDRPLIGRSNLLYACTNHSFALSSANHWHRRAGHLMSARTRTMGVYNKIICNQIVLFTNIKKYKNHYMTDNQLIKDSLIIKFLVQS